ncbi:MAG TPA: cytochrome c, partial [Polyangiaceae bacterium]
MRHTLAVAVSSASLAVLSARGAHAEDGDTTAREAQRLEHTLGYLAADYARFGRSEHNEHAALATQAERIATGLSKPIDVAARVATIWKMIDESARAEEVGARVDELRTLLVGAYRIEDGPAAPPSVTHGRALYEQNCAVCHGLTGHADTPTAAAVRPHPVNFLDPLFGETLTPYEITTTIRFGIAGTAMVPFVALSDADRWDIACYILGLRHPGPLAADPPSYSLRELANRSDETLRGELSALPLASADIEPAVAALRRRISYERPPDGSLALARADVDRARIDVTRGERDAANKDVQQAVKRGLRPAAAALWSVDPAVGQALDGTLAYLSERVRADARPAEL